MVGHWIQTHELTSLYRIVLRRHCMTYPNLMTPNADFFSLQSHWNKHKLNAVCKPFNSALTDVRPHDMSLWKWMCKCSWFLLACSLSLYLICWAVFSWSESTIIHMSLGHFYFYCMYMFMCTCVHICMYVWRSEVDVSSSITPCFWRQDLSPNLELFSLLRLTSQGASGDPIVSPAFSSSPALGLQCPVVVILEIQTWVPMLAKVALYQVVHHLTLVPLDSPCHCCGVPLLI